MRMTSAVNIGPIPPKSVIGNPMPMANAAPSNMSASFRTLTHATARMPLANTKAATSADRNHHGGRAPDASRNSPPRR